MAKQVRMSIEVIEEIIYPAAVKLDFRRVGDKRAISLYNIFIWNKYLRDEKKKENYQIIATDSRNIISVYHKICGN